MIKDINEKCCKHKEKMFLPGDADSGVAGFKYFLFLNYSKKGGGSHFDCIFVLSLQNFWLGQPILFILYLFESWYLFLVIILLNIMCEYNKSWPSVDIFYSGDMSLALQWSGKKYL